MWWSWIPPFTRLLWVSCSSADLHFLVPLTSTLLETKRLKCLDELAGCLATLGKFELSTKLLTQGLLLLNGPLDTQGKKFLCALSKLKDQLHSVS